jgi:hypothetical protein
MSLKKPGGHLVRLDALGASQCSLTLETEPLWSFRCRGQPRPSVLDWIASVQMIQPMTGFFDRLSYYFAGHKSQDAAIS